ncbi:MAG: DUF192 domain-containing protein [Candidatus Aenigmarchaeota archaeon]|nr:DUF192 domain-containing protein [Candidatus Aenigmarchaeota archaeon]
MAQKMSPLWIFLALAFAVVLLMFLFPLANQENNSVCFGSECFTVELARTPDEHSRGLMGRQFLSQDSGMLFVFPDEGVYPFWMKNTQIPLDIIWLDSNRSIVFIKRNAQPCGTGECSTINPGKSARYVLEVNGGTSDRISLREGDKAAFEISA